MTMPKYPPCAFCQETDYPLHKEDVFANWIAKLFPHVEWTTVDLKTGKIRSRSTRKQTVGLICDKVCKKCNNEWMSILESNVKLILKSLIFAERNTPLIPSEQRKLAKWLIKTANTADLAVHGTHNCFFTPNDRLKLTRGLMLPSTDLFIAQFSGTLRHIAVLGGTLEPDASKIDKENRYLSDTEGYVFTLTIQHVTFQVFSVRSSNPLPKKLTFIPSPFWASDVTARLWPPTRKPINWPLRFSLDNALLRKFNNRWFTAIPRLS